MKRFVAIAVSILALAACGHDGPKAGTVVKKDFTPAHDEWVNAVYIPGSCFMVGKVEDCNPATNIPGHYDHYNDEWSIYLDDGKHKGWRDVNASTYDACKVNAWCNTSGAGS